MKKKADHIIEDNIPAGNWDNKYTTKNPLALFFLNNFLHRVKGLITPLAAEISSITEVGCGEGYLSREIQALFPQIALQAQDFSQAIIEVAKRNNPNIAFSVKSIYDIGAAESADLMVCCEVLEHLEYPEQALERLSAVTKKFCVLSVPDEPLWRILNVLRCKYLRNLGNTPGHIQHWSRTGFIRLVSRYMKIAAVQSALPWTIVLCKK